MIEQVWDRYQKRQRCTVTKNGFVAVSVEAGLSHAFNTENMKKQILHLKRQMKVIERLAVFEESAWAATALLGPSAHPRPCLLPSFLYICPVPVLYFHSRLSSHHLSVLTLSLDHLLGCLFQPIPLRPTPQPWVFHSRHSRWGSRIFGDHPVQILQSYGKPEQIRLLHSGCSQR